jgi:hypothetical protein
MSYEEEIHVMRRRIHERTSASRSRLRGAFV